MSQKLFGCAGAKLEHPKSIGGMGFKEFECFNKVLLAKQVWCLVQRLDTLVALIFKEQYYSHGTSWSFL